MLLRRGARGEAVRRLSEDLMALEYLRCPQSEFDNVMDRAVRAFQAQALDPRGEPLAVDGIVGPLTRFALDLALGRRDRAVLEEAGPGSRFGLAALEIARAEMARGAGETGGNNRGPDVQLYLDGRVGEGANWCAGFVSWCYREGSARIGQEMPFKYSLGARDIRNQFRRKGWDFEAGPDDPPRAGDIIVWWRGAINGWQGHIGLVERHADGIVTTIEGNRGPYPSRVQRYSYVLGRIQRLLGFGRVLA
ncbi:MAG: CHAP domain-containing protein [Salinarimonas sp.]